MLRSCRNIGALLRTFPANAADSEALTALERHNELVMLIRHLNGDVISSLTARINALQRELLLRLAASPAASLPHAPSVGLVALPHSPSPSAASAARPPVPSGQPVTPSDSAPSSAA